MFLNQFVQLTEFRTKKATGLSKLDRLKPEFRVSVSVPDMDMTRLIPFAAEEEKAISTDSKHLWHSQSILGPLRHSQLSG